MKNLIETFLSSAKICVICGWKRLWKDYPQIAQMNADFLKKEGGR